MRLSSTVGRTLDAECAVGRRDLAGANRKSEAAVPLLLLLFGGHVAPVLQREAMLGKLRPQDEVTAADQCTVGVDVLTSDEAPQSGHRLRYLTGLPLYCGLEHVVNAFASIILPLATSSATLSRSKCTSRLSKYARSCSGSFVMKSARRRSTVLSKKVYHNLYILPILTCITANFQRRSSSRNTFSPAAHCSTACYPIDETMTLPAICEMLNRFIHFEHEQIDSANHFYRTVSITINNPQ